jgi:hypothetical protein
MEEKKVFPQMVLIYFRIVLFLTNMDFFTGRRVK